MKRIRPIRADDLDALLDLAKGSGAGFTSLPPVREFLAQKIELSLKSFAADVQQPGHERYLLVVEDSETGEVGGCCAVEAACGLDEPFYNYHVGTKVYANRELSIYNRVPTLYLSNDLTGTSVLCSLYLRKDFRGGKTGHLLSRCRFLLMAQYQQRFAAKVIAEMRGVSDAQERSPFWEGLGRHFFTIDYAKAEHLVGMGNKAIIAELMPNHPIYTVLLPPEARDVLGKVHQHTAPALHLLQQEGFRYQGYIDIFDGGPTVEAPMNGIRSVVNSRLCTLASAKPTGANPVHLVANTALADFRCVLAELPGDATQVALPPETAKALDVTTGDTLRVCAL